MNIDLLIKMANQIGDFFTGAAPEQASRDVANHLKRYWDPRMRAQILSYLEERQGAGLSDVALAAVTQLKADKSPPTAPGATAPGAKP
jgi:formate dehydrogenase subunit delta